MNTDWTSGVSVRRVALVVGIIVLLIVPTGAVMVNAGVVDVLGEQSGLTLSRSDGPNGQYVQLDAEDQLTVNISTNGVNLESTAKFDRTFVVNNTGEEPREVWINHTNSDILSLYDSDTRLPIGFEERVTLAPGERIEVGIHVDTTGSSTSVGETIDSTLTIHSRDLTPDDGPKVSLADQIDFGNVTNGTLASRTVKISNDGGAPLALGGVSLSGSDADSFSLAGAGTLPETISPGESVTISIEALPERTGIHRSTLTVTSNDTATPLASVPVSANSVETELTVVSGGQLGFGQVEIDTAVRRTVTIRNDGSTTVDITDARLNGSDAAAFAVVEAGVIGELAPGESVSVPVIFKPERTGSHSATLEVLTAGGIPVPATVGLDGTGIISADISVDPTIVDFGDVGLNEHANATLTITNDGEQPLTISELSVRGADADQFALQNGIAGTTLAAGESRTVTVSSHPTREGDLDAELRITSSDPDTPIRTIPLAVTSVPAEIGVEPENLDFGNVTVGASKTLEVRVWNEEDSIADLHVETTATIGRNPEAFEVTANRAPFTLAPGEERTIEVTYSPDTAGIKTAQLRILSNGDEQQIDVWMSNTGWRIRVQEVKPGSRSVDAETEDFNLDTSRIKSTATNVEVDVNDLPEKVDVHLNVSTPGTRNRRAGAQEVSFRTRQGGTFDMNFVHDEEPPLPESNSFTPPTGQAITQYITLYHSVENEAFEQPSLVYQVKRSNLAPGTDPDEVVFRRFEEGEWVTYETTLLRTTPTHFVYRVSLPGFSEFVVTAPASEDEGGVGGGGGDTAPDQREAPADESPTRPEDDPSGNGVEVIFGSDADAGGITVTELDSIPGTGSGAGPLATIDRLPSDDGDAEARIGTTQRSVELRERIEAAGADTLVDVGDPITLTGRPSVVRSANGIDGRGQIVRAVDITVPESRRDQPATIRLVIDRARFGQSDPATAQMGHYTGTGWQILPTNVVSITEERVVVEARTPGFSPFAVFVDNQVQFTWKLPDGTTLQGQSIEPTFEEVGFHNVTLTVTDAFGRSDTATYRVLANDRPEVAIVAPDTIEPGENVTLAAEVTDEVGNLSVIWHFPDGTEATGVNVTHSFESGSHEVQVDVTDEFGASTEASRTLPVGPSFGAQKLRSMAATMPFEAQVLLSFLLAVTLTLTATRLLGAVSLQWFTTIQLSALLPFRRRHLPEIVTFEPPRLDRDRAAFEVGDLMVEDAAGDLRSVHIEVFDERGTLVARSFVELDDVKRYEGRGQSIPLLSRVYLVDIDAFDVQVTAVDSRADETRSTLSIGDGGE